ncbi:MAG: zinc ribbon domain-containing protein [Candidatus Omnitrophica bacterium]|nr:zinc ribbon domain-containing protein [Candidatus Omnitrophota bacterium]
MPTYEYECEKCGKRFDAFQSIMAEPLTECPKCKGKVNRLISSGIGVIFKGSGFYQTDYKNKKRENACSVDKNKPACDSCNLKKK